MRLLNRPLGRPLAPPPRPARRAAGAPAGAAADRRRCTPPSRPPQASRPTTDADQVGRAASCSWSAARSATARTARASRPSTATSSVRRWSASAPPPSTSRSAPAGCRWPSPGRRPRGRKSSTPTTRSPRSRRTSPRSAPARPSPTAADYSLDGHDRRGAPGGHRPRWPDLPDQLHGLPQLRGLRRRDAARRLRPEIRGVEPKYIYEAMLTGPQAMDNFSNGNLSPEEKRDIIAYLESLEEQPRLRRLRPRRHRPGERGPVRLARGHRLAGRRRGLDRRPHRPFVQEEGEDA